MNTPQSITEIRARGTAVAAQVDNAYMTDMYGPKEWAKVGRWLATQGLDEREIEAVLRSKYMRWASDHNNGKCTSAGFKRFWMDCPTMTTAKAIQDLVDGTF